MKYTAGLLLILMIFAVSCGEKSGIKTDSIGGDMPKPEKFEDKLIYVIGLQLGNQLRQDSLMGNLDYLVLAVKQAYANDTSKFYFNQRQQLDIMNEIQSRQMKRQEFQRQQEEKKNSELGRQNLSENPAFLEANKRKPGVITTPSGMQYVIMKQGKGAAPKITDTVYVNVIAKFKDGKEFDNTYSRGGAQAVSLKEMVHGWQEALLMMKVGAKWRVVLPPELGFGDKGAMPTIPPNAITIWEIELVSIGKAPAKN